MAILNTEVGGARLVFLLCSALFLATCPASRAATRLLQSEVTALRQIAKTMGKTDWNFSVDPCSGESGWANLEALKGFENAVTCACPETGSRYCHITSIVLKGQGLAGTLPQELTGLPYLVQFDVTRNYLNGTIPKAWGALQLVNISLMGNRLSGPIPVELGNITTLKTLSLEENQFSGEVPPHLGNLTNLQRLLLSSNNFTGALPQTLERLTNMTDFRISDTRFFGKLPDFIGKWTQLDRLIIEGTSLEGPIPPGIQFLESLSQLVISGLSGTSSEFPQLTRMKKLKRLILRNCMLSGELPDYIGQLKKLQILDLSFNNLTGVLPSSLAHLKGLDFLYLTNNSLTGSLPDWILTTGTNVDFSYNNFTGTSSSSLSNCAQGNVNLVESYSESVTNLYAMPPCLRKDFPCDKKKPQYSSLHIDCGSKETTNDGNTTFEADGENIGASTFFMSAQGNWALSSTGTFLDNDIGNDDYIVTNTSALSMSNPGLYMNARLSPMSLKYYGLCLWNGPYTVKLHFAEIMFTDDRNFSSLGRRVFDVYIQGKLALKDFNIKDAANGSGKAVVMTLPANVTGNTLEIHFFWDGKGTIGLPKRGVYGPLVSAISVEADFQPPTESKVNKKVIIGSVVGAASALLLVFLTLGILWEKGCLCRSGANSGTD